MPTLEIKNLNKEFNQGSGRFVLINNMSFKFEENEKFLTILAPFGSGKTTLLKMIAGLEQLSGGEILYNGKNYSISGKKIIYLPEKPSSFLWLTVKENITFAASSELSNNNSQIEAILKLIGLDAYPDHFPDSSSIGFRFRIAVGRALALKPAFILIDDSLKLLDSVTKFEINCMLNRINSETGIKFLMATTDISEAVSLADRVIILKRKPTEITAEYNVVDRDKSKLMEFLKQILLQQNQQESINFTI